MKPVNRLLTERRQLSWLIALLAVAALSGIITWLIPGMMTWEQWTFLLHTLGGLLLTVILFPYIWTHFTRTLGLRRPLLAATGLIALAVSLILCGTGVWISIFGQREAQRAVMHWHIGVGLLVFAVLLLHLVSHWLFLPTARRGKDERFPSITSKAVRTSIFVLGGSLTAVILLTAFTILLPSPYKDEAVVQPYTMDYGSNPFAPSFIKTAKGGFLDPDRLDNSKFCGECHTDIFRQWQSSMHGKAGSDAAYQLNIKRLAEQQGIEAIRYCDSCHTPVAVVAGVLTEGGSLTTRWHMEEGVNCRSCHSVDRVLHTRGNGSYRLNPNQPYLFGGYENTLAVWLRKTVIRLNPEVHRESLNEPILSTARFCSTCHAQFMDTTMNNWGWVKMQDEYLAWLNSPYSGHTKKTFANEDVRNCRDCHMPLVNAEDPSESKHGQVLSHRFPGANMTIPYVDGDMKQLEVNRDFLQADRVRVTLIPPEREHSIVSRFSVGPGARREDEESAYYYLGEEIELQVVVHNLGVGHDFPGGTIDINQAWLSFQVVDANDRVVYSSGSMNEEGFVDPDAYFYRSLPVDRHGQRVWKHELFNMVGASYVNVIPSGEADLTSYSFTVPNWVKSPLTVRCTLRYRKFNQRYAEFILQAPGIEVPVADMAFDTLTLPIRERPEAFTHMDKEQGAEKTGLPKLHY